jgi:predicted nucleotidyltransferase
MTYQNTEVVEAIAPYFPSNYEVLQVSETGSYMWSMQNFTTDHGTSDHDLVVIYRASTKDILKGRTIHSTLPCKHHIIINNQEYDFNYLEVGHFCHQLKKGNINMIWALLSPLIIYRKPVMTVLYDIIQQIHTADIIPSSIGMTTSQLNDVIKRADVRSPEKSLKTAYRTINFALNHLITGGWDFKPVTTDVTKEDILNIIDNIKTIELNNRSDKMPSDSIEQWIYQLRVVNI